MRTGTRPARWSVSATAASAGPTDHEVGGTGLGTVAVPPLEEINAQAELRATRIDAAEFERLWAARPR